MPGIYKKLYGFPIKNKGRLVLGHLYSTINTIFSHKSRDKAKALGHFVYS